MAIVLTRVTDDYEVQRQWRGAICTGIAMVPVRRAVAVMWSHSESAERMAQARAYAPSEGYTVRVLANTRDVLDNARALALGDCTE